MCEYCGCQSVPAIAELTAEHDQIREVARDLDTVAQRHDLPVAVELADRLLTLLAPHTAVEEQGLFPAIAGEFGAHVDSLQDDHRRIEQALGDLAAGDPADGWPLQVRAVVSELFDHILREQDGLFPAALSMLTSQQWEHLDELREELTTR
ncbi:MAG TPA: hemerythrin domain-containing protein [Jatrophihabitantaceae bacterium]|jgi:hemerythrin-like domain-containing protein|nr:hemerythrin domain-containing protein [Jatrophihabitantaceae bacterium]